MCIRHFVGMLDMHEILDFRRVRRGANVLANKREIVCNEQRHITLQWSERGILTPTKVRAVYLNSAPLASVQLSQFSPPARQPVTQQIHYYLFMCACAVLPCTLYVFTLGVSSCHAMPCQAMRHFGSSFAKRSAFNNPKLSHQMQTHIFAGPGCHANDIKISDSFKLWRRYVRYPHQSVVRISNS